MQRLEDYILQIQQYRQKENIAQVDYRHGFFTIGAETRGISREIDCKLAQKILTRLTDGNVSIHAAFSDYKELRKEIARKQRSSKWLLNVGMHSDLEQIIKEALQHYEEKDMPNLIAPMQ